MRRLILVLALIAMAAMPLWPAMAGGPTAMVDLSGQYRTTGTNPGGQGSYTGETTITRNGDTYAVVQRAGNVFRGVGTVRGNIFEVRFDGGIVATYTIMPNGVLQGTWTQPGNPAVGQETLTPMR